LASYRYARAKEKAQTHDRSMMIDGLDLKWELISEPQWTTEGAKGLCISVRMEDGHHRELILEYPFPRKPGSRVPQLPQRPKFTEKTVEADIRQAMASGWDPESRGKTFVFHVPKISD
jgi:hypothetical protein